MIGFLLILGGIVGLIVGLVKAVMPFLTSKSKGKNAKKWVFISITVTILGFILLPSDPETPSNEEVSKAVQKEISKTKESAKVPVKKEQVKEEVKLNNYVAAIKLEEATKLAEQIADDQYGKDGENGLDYEMKDYVKKNQIQAYKNLARVKIDSEVKQDCLDIAWSEYGVDGTNGGLDFEMLEYVFKNQLDAATGK